MFVLPRNMMHYTPAPESSSGRPTGGSPAGGGQPARRTDLSETSPIEAGAAANRASRAGNAASAVSTSDASSGPENPNEKTRNQNIDTFVGRLVVDQGLATPEEVQQCLEQARIQVEEANQRSLVELLIENDYITRRQATRLKNQAEAEATGQQIPGYKIIGKLGAGAMAAVWKARQLSLDRLVAIKVLPRKFNQNTQFIERFYAEGRAAAQLNHPNIVQAYDVGRAGEFHYFVMEYVDGRTVFDDIARQKRCPEAEALEIAIQIGEALLHAHERGLIHRDVKPKNLMITKDGVAKLADMGLARAVSDAEAAEAEKGKAFGTPYYISPEQIRGEVKIGPPADIYSLGATLYHMVTGVVPFDGKNPTDVMNKHLKHELTAPDHVNPKLSTGISEIIEMMMAKDPRKRYQNCKDLLTDLRAVKAKQKPPLAHKDIAGVDLAALAQVEKTATDEIAVDQSRAKSSRVSMGLFITMCGLLVVSVIFNLVQAVT
jgi:eukaryotic-like serine/threonine-protein kinase